MTYGSLFSGIGGIDLGLDRAGMTCKWQVEIDPFCRKVLAKHWPDVERFEDVRAVGKHNLSGVDLVCGGFPCQDISYAGAGAGIDGERSGLWSEFARVLRVVRPRFAIVENVPALLARGMDRVLTDLAEIGFDAEWQVLPAQAFGAWHLRERLFIVAHANGDEHKGGSHADRRTPTTHLHDANGNDWKEMRRTASWSGRHLVFAGRGVRGIEHDQHFATEPALDRVAHGVPRRVDRLRGLGNAVVPQMAEWIGRAIMEANNA